jgi:hypothetical protein
MGEKESGCLKPEPRLSKLVGEKKLSSWKREMKYSVCSSEVYCRSVLVVELSKESCPFRKKNSET